MEYIYKIFELAFEHPWATFFFILAFGWGCSVIIHGEK